MLTFLNDYIGIQVVLCVLIAFIERLIRNFIPAKLRGIFLQRKTASSAHRIKSYKKLLFCQNYVIFLRKMIYAVIERYFPLF